MEKISFIVMSSLLDLVSIRLTVVSVFWVARVLESLSPPNS